MPVTTSDRATELQRKIFTRWANQKLELGKKQPVKDIVTGLGDGTSLVDLVSVLSEKEWPGKPLKKTNMRMQQADQVSRALTWVFGECGVVTKVPPCAENLMDGEERPVMGLVWAIMQKFLKFGDDEDGENLSAEDSLLMWVQNQLLTYSDIEVKNFTKSFHNGLAYAALIHKFRPNLIDPSQLNPGDAQNNLKKVFAAAKTYFELEEYIEPFDIAALDSKSAFIFLSEFYYGIAKQRKVDLACRRITKLVHFTKKNDELRAQYQEKADLLLETLAKVTVELNDRSIDNTMSGAQARIAAFQAYKAGDKLTIVDSFLSIESLYNQLAMRLADHERPPYNPGANKSVSELRDALKTLEETELERQVALVQELNRQIRLKQLDEQHQTKYNHMNEWQIKNEALLKVKESIESSGQAEYQINRLSNYNDESDMLQNSTAQEMTKLGAELVSEKFEFSAAVQQRESTVQSASERMSILSFEKMEVLKDDLARMKVKEATHLVNLKHKAQFSQLRMWAAEKEAYLRKEETITSVADANLQLSVLEMYREEAKDVAEGSVVSLKAVGKEILSTEYSSTLSSWKFETPEEVTDREGEIDLKMNELGELQEAKKAILDDALKLELEKERLRLLNLKHKAKFSQLQTWHTEKEAYLKKEESILSVADANLQLSVLEMYHEEAKDTAEGSVVSLKTVGQEILSAEYVSTFTNWKFETPEEVTDREGEVDTKMKLLGELEAAKKATLDEALKLELEKERLRLLFATEATEFSRFADSVVEASSSSHFGFTLQEVEAYANTMQANEEATSHSSSSKQAKAKATYEQAVSLGVTENVYTTLDLQQVSAMADRIIEAHAFRRSAYSSELERQRTNDKLCQTFAELAGPFVANVEAGKESITSSSDNLETQLSLVESKQGEIQGLEATSAKIVAVQADITAAKVQNNPHSHYTAKDITVLLQQYVVFLERKNEQLGEEIEHKALRGLTKEQHEEIEVQFKTFDKDDSGKLSKSEFKSCLYSLGEDKTSTQVAEVMEKYGSVLKGIAYKGFKDFMIEQLGDTDTAEEIISGFELVNKGPLVNVERMQSTALDQMVIDYIVGSAPKIDSGYDYKAWTAEVFAR